jgi:SAM-dependent methyltransferase
MSNAAPTSARRSLAMKLREGKRALARSLLALGMDPRPLKNWVRIPKYLRQYSRYKSLGGQITHTFPILLDYEDQAGRTSGHYFHQDLLVASLISEANPDRHVDIGSRIDGFVAHVASFRAIDVLDVRELRDTGHPRIRFVRADLMNEDKALENMADSISCLHAIEHFGLGRYGDPLNPDGHKLGFNNILRMLKPGGTLYISFPIGKSNEVHFNAHRVFHPKDIFGWADSRNTIKLLRFDYVDDAGNLNQNIDVSTTELNVHFGCGIYSFRKVS